MGGYKTNACSAHRGSDVWCRKAGGGPRRSLSLEPGLEARGQQPREAGPWGQRQEQGDLETARASLSPSGPSA